MNLHSTSVLTLHWPPADSSNVSTRLIITALVAGVSAFAQTPVLTPTPASLTFTWQTGNALPSGQALAIKSGTSTAAFTTSIVGSNALWLSVSPDTGKLPAALTVRVNPSGLAVGTYTASVRLTA